MMLTRWQPPLNSSYVMAKAKVFKVGQISRSKFMVPRERSCNKECTCEIWKPHLFWHESYSQSFPKVGQSSRSSGKLTRGPKGHISCTWVQCASFLTDQPGQKFLFTHRPEKHKLGRRRWDLASCQVSLNSVQRFNRRSRKCLSQSEARAAILFFRSARKTQTW